MQLMRGLFASVQIKNKKRFNFWQILLIQNNPFHPLFVWHLYSPFLLIDKKNSWHPKWIIFEHKILLKHHSIIEYVYHFHLESFLAFKIFFCSNSSRAWSVLIWVSLNWFNSFWSIGVAPNFSFLFIYRLFIKSHWMIYSV